MGKALRLYKVTDCIPYTYQKYRYLMSFESKKPINNGKTVAVVLMNPSTAGYIDDKPRVDSTIGKVLCWCHRNNFAVVEIVNLFAFRETYPDQLLNIPYAKLVGPKNNATIRETCIKHEVVITAWGNCEGVSEDDFARRTNEVVNLIEQKSKLHYVGALTEYGNPRHGRSWNFSPQLYKWND